MPTPTYTPLATKTLTTTATSVTFSGISQAYRDLRLVVSVKGSVDGYSIEVSYNADTSYSHTAVRMYGTGTAAASQSGIYYWGNVYQLSATNITQIGIDVMDYSQTDKHKSALFRIDTANGTYGTMAGATRWPSTAAITGMTFAISGGSGFASGSTFTLYGIAA